MSTPNPFRTAADRLAPLFAEPSDERVLWRPEELGAIWRHQLEASLEFDLAGLDETMSGKLRALRTPAGTPVVTFGELLRHPHPDPELLGRVKDFAKTHWSHPASLLPRETALALYHAAVAAAALRCGLPISSLDPLVRQEGLRRVLAFPWLDAGTRSLLQEAVAT